MPKTNYWYKDEKAAIISDCGRFRYALSRIWDRSKPFVLWVMFNPSTADATKDGTPRHPLMLPYSTPLEPYII